MSASVSVSVNLSVRVLDLLAPVRECVSVMRVKKCIVGVGVCDE